MLEVIQMLENEDRAIIFGDWNVASTSEFNTLLNAGFKPLNGGYLPYKRTYNYDQNYTSEADTSQDRFFDNIFIKGDGFGFRTVHEVYDKMLSDHLPISAKITIY